MHDQSVNPGGGSKSDIIVTGTTAGDDLIVPSSSRVIQMLYGQFIFTTSAVAGVRKALFQVVDGTPRYFLTIGQSDVGASGNFLHAFGPSSDSLAHLGVQAWAVIPANFLLWYPLKLKVTIIDGQAGDVWTFSAACLDWMDLS